ncbi:MAG: CRISPR-associated endoribonuclease Cas6 [Candidatus Marinimicrobia bacterium CG08_land_8_20_14_0_20_45_22]|nr:MAG: CRISPR-associated endoribonuclease Cas6 [Candidatus Marinimicrobia bacterium CG08_land_8_20_14_0_20_45_22]
MRLKINASSVKPVFIPFNYQYQLSAAIYNLISKSSGDYAQFLHNSGFRLEDTTKKSTTAKPTDQNRIVKIFKLFTFSKLHFFPYSMNRNGFDGINEIEFIFSTPVSDSYKHLVFGVFSDQIINLNFFGQNIAFHVDHVESLIEPVFISTHSFTCLSPITVSTSRTTPFGKREQHFLDYLQPEERIKFEENIKQNLIRKYKVLSGKTVKPSKKFEFAFDMDYIIRKQGQISKLIHFKDDIKIKAFEAPFTIKAKPELIQTGYTCGFGEKNSDGFGCAEIIKADAEKR